jgi:septal ring factor EnvC (AmiA/AmiB activator)
VVVDIGHGRFAFYAHFQPNTLKVKVGDKVRRGQVLALMGRRDRARAGRASQGGAPTRKRGDHLPEAMTATGKGRWKW